MYTPALSKNRLPEEFYLQPDVASIARQLLGKVLLTHINGTTTGGIITETEAYSGESDRASHAFGGRRTHRTATLYQKGGIAYIYLCYGIHHLFNVVTHNEGFPHAVLIRALHPLAGFETIARRMGKDTQGPLQLNGPGKLSRALGITVALNATPLSGNTIWISDHGCEVSDSKIKSGPRIGVDYAGSHALWPMRFWVDDAFLSNALKVHTAINRLTT